MTEANNDVEVPKRTVAFRSIKRKQKQPAGRASKEPKDVLDALTTDWVGLQDELFALPADEQEAMKEHFNDMIDEHDALGDILYGEKEEFEAVTNELDSDTLKSYTDEIIRVELVDP